MRFKSATILGIALLFVGAVQAQAQGGSPTSHDAAVASAQKAADAWLNLLDGAQYGASWDNSATSFQKAVTKDKWMSTVQKVRGQVGPLGARTMQQGRYTTTVPSMAAGEYVIMQYRTVSGSGGFVTETVTLQRDGTRGWRVAGYVVKPA